jgi:3-methyladenine DNA glycosylase Tag
MRDYQWLHEYNLNRFGSAAALEAHLPDAKSPAQLRKIGNDRYLSALALRVFRAGLKHSLVDAKWPTFEEVFFRFDPEKVVLMGAEHGHQLGGMSAPSFLRMVGKDTFIPTYDMVAGLVAQKVIDKAPTSLKDLAAVQAAFNQWHAESGRPMCQLSLMLAYTVNH